MFTIQDVMSFLSGIIVIGGVISIFTGYVSPVLKIGKRIEYLEKQETSNFKLTTDTQYTSNLLCKAMIAMIDDKLTGSNLDGLKKIKDELMEHITKGMRCC